MVWKSKLFWQKSGDEAEVVQCPFNYSCHIMQLRRNFSQMRRIETKCTNKNAKLYYFCLFVMKFENGVGRRQTLKEDLKPDRII